jgi:hypothetical protein
MLTTKEIITYMESRSKDKLSFRLNRRYDCYGIPYWLIKFNSDWFMFDTLDGLEALCTAYQSAQKILEGGVQVDSVITVV